MRENRQLRAILFLLQVMDPNAKTVGLGPPIAESANPIRWADVRLVGEPGGDWGCSLDEYSGVHQGTYDQFQSRFLGRSKWGICGEEVVSVRPPFWVD